MNAIAVMAIGVWNIYEIVVVELGSTEVVIIAVLVW